MNDRDVAIARKAVAIAVARQLEQPHIQPRVRVLNISERLLSERLLRGGYDNLIPPVLDDVRRFRAQPLYRRWFLLMRFRLGRLFA